MTHRSPEENPSPRIAVMAGSFNPFTVGHLSVLTRGLKIFSRIIILIGRNASKPAEAEAAATRANELRRLLAPLAPQVDVRLCTGLVAREAADAGATALLRGVRSVADYEYERNMADINRLISGLETVLLFAEPAHAAISSSIVRELSSYGVDVSAMLPSATDIEQTKKHISE